MALITDNYHQKKLNKYNVNIKTKYIVGNKILERNTDNSLNDDIKKGIRCEKQYFISNRLMHTEKSFDSRIEYTFVSSDDLNKEHECINCGMISKVEDFLDGCPYCRTYYNIDYSDKDLGSKYHYDRVLRSNTYKIVVGIVDLIISFILSFLYIALTSRTFNNYDIFKIIIFGLILSVVLYYFFYILDAYIVLGPIKKYKDKQNKKQIEFWNKTKIDKKIFFNNLNYEIRKYYYNSDNIIDYDILDYIEFKDYVKDNNLHVDVLVDVRVVNYENGKITSKYIKDKFTMRKHDKAILELKDGVNYIKCYNCGSSIDAEKGKCDYCHSENNYLQEWTIVLNK